MSVGAKDNLSSLKFDIIYRHAINVGDIGSANGIWIKTKCIFMKR